MNCQQADKYIYEYCDARLSPELTQEFEEHLVSCQSCTDLVILTRFENDFLYEFMTAAALNPDDSLTTRIMASLPAASVPSPALTNIQIIKPSRSRRPLAYFAAAAAASVLLFTAVASGWFEQFVTMQHNEVAVHDSQPAPRENASFDFGQIAGQSSPLDITVQNQAIDTQNMDMDEDKTPEQESAVMDYSGSSAEAPPPDTAKIKAASFSLPVQMAMADQSALKLPATEIQRGVSSPAVKAFPDRYNSYSVNLIKPIPDISLAPDNLPENYVLESTADGIYVYTDTDTDKTVQILIKPYAVSTAKTTQPQAQSSASSDENITLGSAEPTSSPQRLEVIAKYEETHYLLTLESNLTQDELLALVSEITLTPAE